MRKKMIVVVCFFCLIQGAFGQYDNAVKKPEEVAAEYVRFFSNLGFSAAEIIIHNGYWDLYDEISVFHELDLAVLDKKELRLLRNAIYARHGLIFKSEDLQLWFSQFPWYKPQYADVDDKLTHIDKANIRMIQIYENPVPDRNITAADLTGEWTGSGFPLPAGLVDGLAIHEDGTIELGYNTMGPRSAWMTKGTYSIEDGYLVVMITEQRVVLGGYFMEGWGSVSHDIGNPKECKLVYEKPVRAVFPIGELNKTYQGQPERNWKLGGSTKFKLY